MRKVYLVLLSLLVVCVGCQWQMTHTDAVEKRSDEVVIERFDRVERLYLTMADFAALQQLKTDYAVQTRTLLENVLQLGPVNDPDICTRWLVFFQDSTLQALLRDVEQQYADMDDLNKQLTGAFRRLARLFPDMEPPRVYAQVGSLDQSIVVTDSMLGISLDKYLGADYSAYLRYGYSERQRRMMTREYIVPDCLGFYLLSLFPLPQDADSTRARQRWHMMKIQYVVNQVIGQRVFSNDTISQIEKYRKSHPQLSVAELIMLDSIR
ncbi:MAG: gliding motility protein GldB [Prevotella sp.]|nr:gliding motility protein GldB [Prevotella sp.]